MLGRQAVVDAEGVTSRCHRLGRRLTTLHADAAGDEAAPVEVQDRSLRGRRRAIPLGSDATEVDVLDRQDCAHRPGERRLEPATVRCHEADVTGTRGQRGPEGGDEELFTPRPSAPFRPAHRPANDRGDGCPESRTEELEPEHHALHGG
jgi:hypothetical protein